MAIILLVLCYLFWGIFPIYWKQLAHIPSVEILCHRILWSFLFYGITMLILNGSSRDRVKQMYSTIKFERTLWSKLFLSSLMITGNWFLYIYAVNSGQIMQGSLAYYITPLISVVAGGIFFKEYLSTATRWALGFCGLGVFLLMFGQSILYGEAPHIPWLALSLAFSFFAYGWIKKSVTIPAISSSFIEGLFFAIPSAYYIFWSPHSTLEFYSHRDWLLFVLGGIVTGLPLVFFSYAAQRLPFSTIGFFQYLSPTLQFLTAVMIYSEDFGIHKKLAFICIWIGVSFYIYQLITKKTSNQTEPFHN